MSLNKKETRARLVKKALSALEIAALIFQASCVRPTPIVSPTPKISLPPAGLVTPPPGTETAPVAGLNVTPDIQKFLADHKVPYTVVVDGSATIDLADTSTTEKKLLKESP